MHLRGWIQGLTVTVGAVSQWIQGSMDPWIQLPIYTQVYQLISKGLVSDPSRPIPTKVVHKQNLWGFHKRTLRLNINTYTYKNKNLKNRKLKRKRKQKRKRGSLREGREAPPRRCPHPFRFCFRFRFNFRFFNFLFLYVYVLIFNCPVPEVAPVLLEQIWKLHHLCVCRLIRRFTFWDKLGLENHDFSKISKFTKKIQKITSKFTKHLPQNYNFSTNCTASRCKSWCFCNVWVSLW